MLPHDDKDLLQSNSKILNASVSGFLCREHKLARFRVKAYKAGIRTVGDLISRPAEEIFKLAPTSKDNQDRIRGALRGVGLDLR